MKILNIHKRIISQPKKKIVELLKTLSSENDKIWPNEKWPKMKFESGIRVGAKGGHGPIRYSVEKYNINKIIQFKFSKPIGFNGIHKFEIQELSTAQTEIKHTIDMDVKGKGLLTWFLAIRYLHNALIEDAFDKIENNLSYGKKTRKWNFWTKFLREQISKKQN